MGVSILFGPDGVKWRVEGEETQQPQTECLKKTRLSSHPPLPCGPCTTCMSQTHTSPRTPGISPDLCKRPPELVCWTGARHVFLPCLSSHLRSPTLKPRIGAQGEEWKSERLVSSTQRVPFLAPFHSLLASLDSLIAILPGDWWPQPASYSVPSPQAHRASSLVPHRASASPPPPSAPGWGSPAT